MTFHVNAQHRSAGRAEAAFPRNQPRCAQTHGGRDHYAEDLSWHSRFRQREAPTIWLLASLMWLLTRAGMQDGAVEQLSRSLAKELGPRGITVNVVFPGPTDTELFNVGETEEQRQRLAQASAFGRLGQPPEIAEVEAFLASDAANWVTGQNVRVNGGVA